ncbi:hypothetical protein BH18THE2_BH18THE2_09320 [soil metagenome]
MSISKVKTPKVTRTVRASRTSRSHREAIVREFKQRLEETRRRNRQRIEKHRR